jgi:hypothetical protein
VAMVKGFVADINAGTLVVAHIEKLNDVPVVFVHGGFTSTYLNQHKKLLGHNANIEDIVAHANSLLKHAVQNCHRIPCSFDHDMFQAGPERGGRGIGGPM